MSKIQPYPNASTDPIKVPRFKEAAGFYASAKSSALMKKIRAKHSRAECMLRKALWKNGYRYRIHSKKIMGHPDIIIARYRTVVFVDGDFWHGYDWLEKKKKIGVNKKYWIPKIERNMQRDMEVNQQLIAQGWTVVRFWEHEIRNCLEGCLGELILAMQPLKSDWS